MNIIDRLKCIFVGHDYITDRAIERERDTWVQVQDGEPIDGCTIIHKCARCGSERKMTASVESAKLLDVPLEWERSVDTGANQSEGSK